MKAVGGKPEHKAVVSQLIHANLILCASRQRHLAPMEPAGLWEYISPFIERSDEDGASEILIRCDPDWRKKGKKVPPGFDSYKIRINDTGGVIISDTTNSGFRCVAHRLAFQDPAIEGSRMIAPDSIPQQSEGDIYLRRVFIAERPKRRGVFADLIDEKLVLHQLAGNPDRITPSLITNFQDAAKEVYPVAIPETKLAEEFCASGNHVETGAGSYAATYLNPNADPERPYANVRVYVRDTGPYPAYTAETDLMYGHEFGIRSIRKGTRFIVADDEIHSLSALDYTIPAADYRGLEHNESFQPWIKTATPS